MFGGLKLGPGGLENGIKHALVLHARDRRTIAGCVFKHVISKNESACARHVLGHCDRSARKVLRDMPRYKARVTVAAAAGADRM